MSHRPNPLLDAARVMFVLRAGAALTTFAFIALIARLLPPDDFGRVVLAMNIAMLASVIGARGQHMLLLRFLPRRASLGPLRVHAMRQAGFGTGVLVIGFVGGMWAANRFGFATGYSTGWAMAAAVLVMAVAAADLTAHFARGLGRHVLSVWPKELAWRSLAGLALLAGLFGAAPDAIRVVLELAGLLVALTVLQALSVARNWPADATAEGNATEEFAATQNHFWLSSVSNIFLANADTLAVGLLLGPVEAGGYFIANRIAQALGFFQSAHNLVLAPAIAALEANRAEAEATTQHAARRMTVPTLAAGLAISAFAAPILGLFGEGFQHFVPVLWLLVAAAIANAASGPGDIVLSMAGQERVAARIALANLIIGAALIPLGIWAMGPTGAALAVLIGTILRKGLCWQAVRLRLGFRVDCLGTRTCLPLAEATPG